MSELKSGLAYFTLVFSAGFVLGTVRVLLVVPRFGVRTAELLELPVMLVVVWLAARWSTRRYAVPTRAAPRLVSGFVALTLLLVAEFTVAMVLAGGSPRAYLAARDPVSGGAYLLSLCVFAAMPALQLWWRDDRG